MVEKDQSKKDSTSIAKTEDDKDAVKADTEALFRKLAEREKKKKLKK